LINANTQELNTAKTGFDCKTNNIGANCEIPCKWSNMKSVPADGTAAKSATTCECKAEVWGADCT